MKKKNRREELLELLDLLRGLTEQLEYEIKWKNNQVLWTKYPKRIVTIMKIRIGGLRHYISPTR